MAAPRVAFTGSVSLLNNNLSCSANGWLACAHNSVNAGSGKLLLNHLASSASRDGPEVTNAKSIRHLDLGHGSALCVSSPSGTQIYNEDATTMLFFQPVNDPSPDDRLKYHSGACVVPSLQQIVIGTSKGTLLQVHAAGENQFFALAESQPASVTAEVADVCYSAAANIIVSAHDNGDLRVWAPQPAGPHVNSAALPPMGQAPVRIEAVDARILVAYGSGTICLYDAISLECRAELTAHARWITAVCVRGSYIASVGEDTVLNVWAVEPTAGQISLVHSSVVTDKLLTGVAFVTNGVAVTAYDTDEIFHVPL